MEDNYKSLFSGFVSGIIHTIIGYPLDTLKTLKQSEKKINNNNLFKGLSYPLAQISIINAVTFGSNNYLKKFNDNNVSNIYTGLISSFICTPLDKYKIMKQYNLKYDIHLKNIIKTYKKTHVVTLRELPATYIYFASYDKLKENNVPIFLSGSIAGVNSWFFTYPFDTIKTRIQSNNCKTIMEAIQVGHLFKGLNYCLARAFIVNGVNFSVYEYMNKLLKNV